MEEKTLLSLLPIITLIILGMITLTLLLSDNNTTTICVFEEQTEEKEPRQIGDGVEAFKKAFAKQFGDTLHG